VLGGDAVAAMAAVAGVLRAGVSTGSTRSPADFVPHQALSWAMDVAAAAATSSADSRRMVRMLPALNHQMWFAWHAAAWSGPGEALQAHGAAVLWTASRVTHVHALLAPPVPVRDIPFPKLDWVRVRMRGQGRPLAGHLLLESLHCESLPSGWSGRV
jgi:hypothetical protein